MARVLFLTDQFVIDPLGIGYLSASLKEAGHKVEMVQLPRTEDGFNIAPAYNLAVEFKPHILAYSTTTGAHRLWREANKELRLVLPKSILTVVGSSHPTFFPKFVEEEGLDIICRGEGCQPLVELANIVPTYPWVLQSLDMPNLWISDRKGSVKQNDVGPPPDLDMLPWPDRELLYKYERNRNNPIRNILGSRGCPFNCPYCYNQAYRELYKGKGKTRRIRNPIDIVDEVEYVYQGWPTKFIYFQDDVLTQPRDWFYTMSDEYGKRFDRKLPYHCHVRADTLVKEDVDQLVNSGCHGVTLAIESGNKELRYEALGRRMPDEQIIQACAWIKESGLRLRTENMIGIPGEKYSTTWETVRLNQKCKPDVPWCSLYQPYPGTKLGQLAEDMGLCKVDPETVRPSFFEDLCLQSADHDRLVNMQKFFGFAVAHPRWNWLVKMLVKLPPNQRYQRFSDWWRRTRYATRLFEIAD